VPLSRSPAARRARISPSYQFEEFPEHHAWELHIFTTMALLSVADELREVRRKLAEQFGTKRT
jgi:hypothetical protein